eukprot:861050-Prymnesium_polylepis.1
MGFGSRIALGLIARANSPPSVAALERRPTLSCSTSIATSGRARSTRLPRGARWPLGRHAPRA